MSLYFRRTKPSRKDDLKAGLVSAGLAMGVAAVSFYLVRIILSREPIQSLPPSSMEGVSLPEGASEVKRITEGGA